MSDLFPHNCYDSRIVNQPEIEYRKAKYPFRMRHITLTTEGEKRWDTTHCPVCFWNQECGIWGSLLDEGTKFCRRCGQKIMWEEEEVKE